MSDHTYAPYGIFGGLFTIGFLWSTSIGGSIFVLGPILPLVIVWPWLFRRLTEMLTSTWLSVLVMIFEKIHGTKIIVCGDAIHRHEKTVVIMNHRTRIDWIFFFAFAFHSKILNRHKVALKSMLKWVPGFGWATQVAAYIFLDRHWETDRSHMDNILSYFVELDSKPNILYFPEGTDLSESNKRKSQDFAKKNDLPIFDYVLQPRTKGFAYFVNTLRNISGIHSVHDVTIAYPFNIPIGEKEVLLGEVPREVHFFIKRYSIEELPKREADLAKWCRQRWAEKEKLLREFYSVPDGSARMFQADKRPVQHSRSSVLWLAFVAWLCIAVVSIYILMSYSFARWYALAIATFYVAETYLIGGFSKMEMILYDRFRVSREQWGLKNINKQSDSGDHNNN